MLEKVKRNFKKPEGLLGKLAGKIMAAENKGLNEWTIRHLHISPGDKVLEVGYGPGYGIDYLTKQYTDIQVDGIDVSKTMKKQAAHRLDKEIEAGEVRLLVGDIADTGLRENHYQKVLAVNNFTLWPDKVSGLQRIFNALVPRGEIAITMQPRQDDAKRHRTRTFARKMKQDLKKSGFRHIRLYYKKFSPEMAVCATAIKPNKT